MQPIAKQLRTTIDAAANAVIRVAEASMLNALKLVTIQRGHDPRDLILVASGGGGPMHAAQLARELGAKRVVIPPYPGVFSAWGMLVSAPRRDSKRTWLHVADAAAIETGGTLFVEMEQESADYFEIPASELRLFHAVEMRYRGQEHTVSVPCSMQEWNLPKLLEAFHRAHEQAYTFRLDTTPAEVVSFHLKAELKTARPSLVAPTANASAAAVAARSRSVDFGEAGRHDCSIYRREALAPGFVATGPALIEELSSTTVVLPGQTLTVDALGLLVITEQTGSTGELHS